MKKNAMLKIAAILMVAVLLTTCAISSTFAKYVTADSSSDSARVAKFGVTVTTDFETLFSDKYDADTGNDEVISSEKEKDDEGNELTTFVNVVAPGTKGEVEGASVITGTPEVAVRVSTVATVDLGANWVCDDEGTYYCPLAVTVNGVTLYGNDFASESDPAAAFADAIEAEIAKCNKDFAPNTKLDDQNTMDVNISWEWAFEADAENKAGIDDVKDTYLGDKANATISIALTQTVTQLDTYTAA